MACRLIVRYTRFRCIRVTGIFTFQYPCPNYRQLFQERASQRVWNNVTPHESVRKCHSKAQNREPNLEGLARVARVDAGNPSDQSSVIPACTGPPLQPVKTQGKKLCLSTARSPVVPSTPLLPRSGANRVSDTIRTHQNGPAGGFKSVDWRTQNYCAKPDNKTVCHATRKLQRPYRKK